MALRLTVQYDLAPAYLFDFITYNILPCFFHARLISVFATRQASFPYHSCLSSTDMALNEFILSRSPDVLSLSLYISLPSFIF